MMSFSDGGGLPTIHCSNRGSDASAERRTLLSVLVAAEDPIRVNKNKKGVCCFIDFSNHPVYIPRIAHNSFKQLASKARKWQEK
jgi:hypothetical protein